MKKNHSLLYRQAAIRDVEAVTAIVQDTKRIIYPAYYPVEVVDFFGQLHCQEHVLRDIKEGLVYVLEVDDTIVGTGSYQDNHITRVYVLPDFEGQGYGSYILNQLENSIYSHTDLITLDASLPACKFYEHHGYHTVSHEELPCGEKAVLVYDIMEKQKTTPQEEK